MLKGEKILRPLLDSDLEFLYKIENDERKLEIGENKQYSKKVSKLYFKL